ncbi:MAG: hypothetical protein C4581_04310 [Nitrospiraceae bacterium]|nr:MAG: hypothetical protein C4581_04310 [Nitrospiraceae bacterium]
MSEQRTFQRFDIITVLEFRLLTALSGVFAGITRNFSYEGFCLETQCEAFEPGDNMEVRLKHPHSEMAVTVPAYVVWKKAADKFACLMGIKLKETELGNKLKMLEIMSAAGDVPVDSFLSGGAEKADHYEEPAAPALDSDQIKKYQTAPAQAEFIDENAGSKKFEDEGLLATEKDMITGKESGYLFDEVFKAAQNEGQEESDMPEAESVESDVPWPRDNALEDDSGRAPGYATRSLKQLLENRLIIYSSIAAVIIGISIYAVFIIMQRPDIVKSQVSVPAQLPEQRAFQEDEEHRPVGPPVRDAGENKAEAPAALQPEESTVSKAVSTEPIEQEAPAIPSKPVPADIRTAADQTKYIQVGAWKNPDNAREMLQKVQKYYPDAYLTSGKKLNRVKIPALNQAQVNSIMKDIEDKFQIKPLISSEK